MYFLPVDASFIILLLIINLAQLNNVEFAESINLILPLIAANHSFLSSLISVHSTGIKEKASNLIL